MTQLPKPAARKVSPTPQAPIEVEKIDPATFAAPPPFRDREAELFAHAEIIDGNTPVTKKPVVPPPPEKLELPPKPKEILETLVSDDLVSRLARALKMQAPRTWEAELEVGSGLSVQFRKPDYDDTLWALGVIQLKLQENKDTSLLMTSSQRENYVKGLSYCRCVQKLQGKFIWDKDWIDGEAEILAVNPAFDGKTVSQVPVFLWDMMAQQIHVALRAIDPNAIWLLQSAIDAKVAEAPAEAKTDADPSSAA